MTAGDYDNDGWPDLYVSNLGGANFLYHNNRDGTFTEVARSGGRAGARAVASRTWFFDYDNDGWPDLFVTSYFTVGRRDRPAPTSGCRTTRRR